MPRPITRSMTRWMAEKTKQSHLLPATSEENTQTFSSLFLPGEIRNMIYRDLVGPRFNHHGIIRLSLFRIQPAITRVNKQIRAESLSIYYAENRFRDEIYLQRDYSSYRLPTGYDTFCRCMEGFAPAQAQSPGVQSSLRHIRELEVEFNLETYVEFITRDARFEKKTDVDFKRKADWWGVTGRRLGGDETNWADRTSIDALIKQWMKKARLNNIGSPPRAQERLIHVL